MLIYIEDLIFSYPGQPPALQGVNLQIQAGERVVGHNGAGKSTLVRHLNALLLPERGHVRVDGWDTRQHPVEEMAQRVGYVFQNPDQQLFASTIWDEVCFGPHNLGFDPVRQQELALRALRLCGLEVYKCQHPYDLPWNLRRWVAIASVLAMDTALVVLDEPTAGQDSAGLMRLAALLDELAQQGKTTLTITHDMEFCAQHFERILLMNSGQIVYDGSLREGLAQPENFTRAGLHLPAPARLAQMLNFAHLPQRDDDFLDLLQAQTWNTASRGDE